MDYRKVIYLYFRSQASIFPDDSTSEQSVTKNASTASLATGDTVYTVCGCM
jgi:hypothetical protein